MKLKQNLKWGKCSPQVHFNDLYNNGAIGLEQKVSCVEEV